MLYKLIMIQSPDVSATATTRLLKSCKSGTSADAALAPHSTAAFNAALHAANQAAPNSDLVLKPLFGTKFSHDLAVQHLMHLKRGSGRRNPEEQPKTLSPEI